MSSGEGCCFQFLRLVSRHSSLATKMIFITPQLQLADHEIEFSAINASGPGGQHVNKTSSAIQLRFDIASSSLPRAIKQRLLARQDSRISKEGVLVIKSQEARSQLRNKEEAIERLKEIILAATVVPRKRIPTKPRKSAVKKRLDTKTQKGRTKQLRKPIRDE